MNSICSKQNKRDLIFNYFFAFFLILLVVIGGEHEFSISYWQKMSNRIMYLEIIFIFSYIITYKNIIAPIVNFNRIWIYIFILFIASITVSYTFSPLNIYANALAIERFSQTIVHLIFFVYLYSFIQYRKVDYELLINSIIASSLLVIVIFIYYYFSNHWSVKYWLFMPPLNSNIRHMAFQIESTLGFMLFFILSNTLRNRWIYYAIFIILLSFLFWMGGRGSIVAFYISFILLIMIMHFEKNEHTQRAVWFFILATIISFLIAQSLSIFDWNGLFHAIQISTSTSDINVLSSGRIEIWINTLKAIKDELLFGYGSQGFCLNNELSSTKIVHPHNFLLQFLVEWGVVGATLILIMLTVALWNGFKKHIYHKSNSNPIYLSSGIVLSILLTQSLVAGVFFHPQATIYFLLALSIWISDNPQKGVV